MTKPIIIKNVLRGQEITATLYLFNSEDKEIAYQLKAEGEIAGWATFYKIDDAKLADPISEIQIPAESRLDATVKFKIPEDAPNGDYAGEVAVFTEPEKNQEQNEMTVGVFQKVGREVLITVTDKENVEVETTIIPFKYGIGKDEPLKIKVIYDNLGNVSVKPNVQLKISKNGNTVFNAIFPYPENEEAVKPKTRKTIPLIEWQTAGQEEGKYQAEVKILLGGEVIKEDKFRFAVGFDIGMLLAALSSIGGGSLLPVWFVIGGLLLLAAVVLSFIGKKQKFLKIETEKQKLKY